jgi:hypothetical protein
MLSMSAALGHLPNRSLLQLTTLIEGTVLTKPKVHAASCTLDNHVNPLVKILLVRVFINIHKRQGDHLEDRGLDGRY